MVNVTKAGKKREFLKSSEPYNIGLIRNLLGPRNGLNNEKNLRSKMSFGPKMQKSWALLYYVALGVFNIGHFSFYTFSVVSFSRTRTEKTRLSSCLLLNDTKEFGSIAPLYEI